MNDKYGCANLTKWCNVDLMLLDDCTIVNPVSKIRPQKKNVMQQLFVQIYPGLFSTWVSCDQQTWMVHHNTVSATLMFQSDRSYWCDVQQHENFLFVQIIFGTYSSFANTI